MRMSYGIQTGALPIFRGADLALAAAHRGAGGIRVLHRLPAGVRAHVHAPGPAQPADAGASVLRLGERVQPVRGFGVLALPFGNLDRKRVVWGKRVSERVDIGGRRSLKTKLVTK